jgi:hypothetical protein
MHDRNMNICHAPQSMENITENCHAHHKDDSTKKIPPFIATPLSASWLKSLSSNQSLIIRQIRQLYTDESMPRTPNQ